MLRENSIVDETTSLIPTGVNSGEASVPIEPQLAEEMAFLDAVKAIGSFCWPFALSRLAVAINILANGAVTPEIGENAVAAGPIMISSVYAILGPVRSFLLSTGILIGKKHGEIKELRKCVDDKTVQIKKLEEEIGTLSRQSVLFGTFLGLVATGLMVAVSPILKTTDMNPSVVKAVQGFLDGTATGLLPIFWSTSDQQFCLATDRKYLPMFFGTLFPILTMAIGYPLALRSNELGGTAGLGYGMSIASWVSFISLRLYFLKEEFSPYQLYKMEIAGLFDRISEFSKLGFPMAFQALSEWGNLFGLSLMLAHHSNAGSIASNGSFQLITAFTLVAMGIGQGITVKVSQELGKLKAAQNQHYNSEAVVYSNNAKTLGYAGILFGTMTAVLCAAIFVAVFKPVQNLFVKTDNTNEDAIIDLARMMWITNAISLIIDTLSNMTSSALAGSKDVMFSPAIRLLMMSAIGIPTAFITTEFAHQNANYFFIIRTLGILAGAGFIGNRLYSKNYSKPEATTENSSPQTHESRWNFFSCFNRNDATAVNNAGGYQEIQASVSNPIRG